jgi:hypothetical protein
MLKTIKSFFLGMNKKGMEWSTLIAILLTVLTILFAIIFLSKGDPWGTLSEIFKPR